MRIGFPVPTFTDEELRAIVEKDWQRSYQKIPSTPKDLYDCVKDWQYCGLPIGQFGKTIFIGRLRKDGIFEFHAINGGTIAALIRGGRILLNSLKGQVDFAGTYYTNPRVGDLALHMPYPYKVAEVNEGPQRRFATIFDLRS